MKNANWLCFVCLAFLVAQASAQNTKLLRAPDNAPQYHLGKIRFEDDNFGRATLVFDYTRLREGKGLVRLAGRSPDGPLQITFAPDVSQASGTIRLNKFLGSRGGGYDYEFYLVIPALWVGQHYGDCLVSNKVRVGSPGPSPPARRWNAKEKAAYEKHLLKGVPPSSLPDGYEVVKFDTPLAPGMRVKAGFFGDWIDSELLACSEAGEATVRFLKSDAINTVSIDGCLAAKPAVLRRAASEPDRFSPSLRVLPGGRTALPRDAAPIPRSLALPPGTPLLKANELGEHYTIPDLGPEASAMMRRTMGSVSGWETVYVVEDLGGTINVTTDKKRDFFGRRDGKLVMKTAHKRYELAIRDQTLDAISDPETVKGWLVNLIPKKERLQDKSLNNGEFAAVSPLGAYQIWEKNHQPKEPIPRRWKKLPAGTEIPAGAPVKLSSFFGKWEPALMIQDEGDTVVVRDLTDHDKWANRMPRYQVIIQEKTLRKIRERARGDVDADGLTKTLRTWTDISGQHKVEAKLVRINGDKVLLRTDAGRDIRLPLKKLSKADQELLRNLSAASDNPFE